jgi:hypothetical protein
MTDGVGAADDPWTLTPADHALVLSKHGETRLGFAIAGVDITFPCHRFSCLRPDPLVAGGDTISSVQRELL